MTFRQATPFSRSRDSTSTPSSVMNVMGAGNALEVWESPELKGLRFVNFPSSRNEKLRHYSLLSINEQDYYDGISDSTGASDDSISALFVNQSVNS